MEEQTIYHKKLVDDLANLIGYFEYKEHIKAKQEESKAKGENITMSSDWGYMPAGCEEILDNCYKFIGQNKSFVALTEIVDSIKYLLKGYVNTINLDDLKSNIKGEYIEQYKVFDKLKEIVVEYYRWEEEEYKPLLEKYKQTKLFKLEEFNDYNWFAPRMFLFIEEAIKRNLFKFYTYKQGSGKINQLTEFYIYPQIGISQSLDEWLSHLDKQNMDEAGDRAVVTLFYKMDYVSKHYNYFIITVHHKDSIWLITDQIDFYNPRNKQSSRKPERHKQNHYENIGLPYDLVDELDEIRKIKSSVLLPNAIKTSYFLASDYEDYYRPIIEKEIKEKEKENEYGTRYVGKIHISDSERIPVIGKKILEDNGIPFDHIEKPGYNKNLWVYKHLGQSKVVILENENKEIKGDYKVIIYNAAEILQKPIADCHTGDKIYFIGLINRIFEELGYQPERERILTADKHLGQLLLGSADSSFLYDDKGQLRKHDGGDDDIVHFEGFADDIQKIFDDLISSIGVDEEQTKALTTLKYQSVVKSKNYHRDWLGTPKSLENVIRWSILEDKADEIRNFINSKISRKQKKDDAILLKSLLGREELIPRLMDLAFNPIKFIKEKEPTFGRNSFLTIYGGDDKIETEHDWIYVKDKSTVKHTTKYVYRDGNDRISLYYDGTTKEITKYSGNWEYEKCHHCKTAKLKEHRIQFYIRHYEQLMILLGYTDRMQLPLSYRNYRSHIFIPYKGNSILDNSHPYSLIEDPLSKELPNGFQINLWMCGNCFEQFKKQYTK